MKKNWRNNVRSAGHSPQSTVNAHQGNVVRGMWTILFVLIVSACTQKKDISEKDAYTCPMHPTVLSDRPGLCPICGMDLVLKGRPGEEIKITEDLAQLIKSPDETVVSTIKTIKGEFKKIPVSMEVQGVVTYDSRNIYTIPSRIGGRLEKVYLKYAFQNVSKGQKVAEIYSPELLTAQRELLFLLENDAENTSLIESSKEKLSLLGVLSSQINRLIKSKEVLSTFSIYSPFDGYVITDEPQPAAPTVSGASSPSSVNMDRMGSSGNASSARNPMATDVKEGSLIREGSYVSSGQTLFKIVNTTSLRVELNVPSSKGALIKKSDPVELDLGDGLKQNAAVDFVQPFFNEGEDFVNVRVYTRDIKNLHIGHLVNAVIKLDSTEGLWIPKKAVLDLGLDKIVFIKDRNILKPQRITTGVQTNGWIEVKQGLASSDEIASNAQFLVDSESFIKMPR